MNKNRVRRYELARRLVVSANTISSWKYRYPDFPQPVGRYYDLAAVTEWKAKHESKESDAGKGISGTAS